MKLWNYIGATVTMLFQCSCQLFVVFILVLLVGIWLIFFGVGLFLVTDGARAINNPALYGGGVGEIIVGVLFVLIAIVGCMGPTHK